MLDEPPRTGRRLWQIARAALFVWLILVAFVALTQRSMIYFPTKENTETLRHTAASQGLEPWTDAQGTLIGYRLPAPLGEPRPPASAIIFHGNAGHAAHRGEYARVLQESAPNHALTVHILEYPGYGDRHGSPSQEAFLAAAAAAVETIPPGHPLVLVGESIGTGVASATAAKFPDRTTGLLLLTPFDSLASVAQHHYPLLPVRWILRDQYPSSEWLRQFHGPVSIMVAANDTIVPAIFGEKLHDDYTGPKQIIRVDRADHNDLLHHADPLTWQNALRFALEGDNKP
jgi:uncharacterized protein